MFNASSVTTALIRWIDNYFAAASDPATKAVVGVSGGKDSSVVLAACVQALGNNRVLAVLMPQGIQDDLDVAEEICRHCNVESLEVNIAAPVEQLYQQLIAAGVELNTVATFNTPARIRMTTLYAIAATVGGRVANTCNLSEDWVGYATKFGDGAGDFSPLAQLTVTEVKAIGRELGLPAKFIEKTPIDGLCGLSDEENLGFSYAELDRYIRNGHCDSPELKAKIDTLHERNLHKLQPMPTFIYQPDQPTKL